MISVKDLAEKEKVRQNIKKELYKHIMAIFSRKIQTAFELKERTVILSVPPFVVGFPKYDLATAVKYLGRQLIRLGYQVNMISPMQFEVSWNLSMGATTNPEPEVIDHQMEFPSLMNLRKAAARYKK